MFSSLKEEENLNMCENLEDTELWKEKNDVIYLILVSQSHIILLSTSRIVIWNSYDLEMNHTCEMEIFFQR